MTPIQLLIKERDNYRKDLDKSNLAFTFGRINSKTHKLHIKNITPLIKQYNEAINKLK